MQSSQIYRDYSRRTPAHDIDAFGINLHHDEFNKISSSNTNDQTQNQQPDIQASNNVQNIPNGVNLSNGSCNDGLRADHVECESNKETIDDDSHLRSPETQRSPRFF